MRVGTSGYSYPAWRPSFYPEGLPPKGFLSYYAARFDTVEINATFYRMPASGTLDAWRAQVPRDFVFALKAPQAITHRKRLRDAGEPTQYFYRVASVLARHRGPVLFQLPPNLKCDLPRLDAFLALLPAGHQAAFEFRHTSWFADPVLTALHSRGAALCIAESEDLSTPVVPTASFGYLRLRERAYSERELARWRDRILAQPWAKAYVFFKHEEEGRGPKLAARLRGLLGPEATAHP